MPILDSVHHERFCQQIAKGKHQREAYRRAGLGLDSNDEVADACASRLRAQPEVQDRISELQYNAAELAEITRKDILIQLQDDHHAARFQKQIAAAIKATELLGRETANMFVDRKEIKAGPLESISVGELEQLREALIAERARRLIEGSGESGELSEDREVLSEPRAIEAGIIPEAS